MRRGIALAGLLTFLQGCGGLARVDPELFPDPPPDSVTFWGHACTLIDLGGVRLVTDPVFEKKTVVRWRKVPMPSPETYADVSYVLLSHAHPDHLSVPTLKTFPEDVTILCPERSVGYLDELGREVRTMSPGDELGFQGGTIVAVDAKHLGGRWSLGHGKVDGGSIGYVIRTPQGDPLLHRGHEPLPRDRRDRGGAPTGRRAPERQRSSPRSGRGSRRLGIARDDSRAAAFRGVRLSVLPRVLPSPRRRSHGADAGRPARRAGTRREPFRFLRLRLRPGRFPDARQFLDQAGIVSMKRPARVRASFQRHALLPPRDPVREDLVHLLAGAEPSLPVGAVAAE